MKSFALVTLGLLILTSCGPRRPGKLGEAGKNGISTGIEVADISPGLACSSGGLSLSTFQDLNNNGSLDSSDPVIKISRVCNGNNGSAGVNGQDGADGTSATVSLVVVAPGVLCPSGGVTISSSSSPSQTICNGVNGLNGADGLAGTQGLPGIAGPVGPQGPAGVNGTSVVPVKFCATDISTYPEYGLVIGNELFAVYWGSTPGSSAAQAFLTKLVAGNYRSTGGNNCLFSIDASNGVH